MVPQISLSTEKEQNPLVARTPNQEVNNAVSLITTARVIQETRAERACKITNNNCTYFDVCADQCRIISDQPAWETTENKSQPKDVHTIKSVECKSVLFCFVVSAVNFAPYLMGLSSMMLIWAAGARCNTTEEQNNKKSICKRMNKYFSDENRPQPKVYTIELAKDKTVLLWLLKRNPLLRHIFTKTDEAINAELRKDKY